MKVLRFTIVIIAILIMCVKLYIQEHQKTTNICNCFDGDKAFVMFSTNTMTELGIVETYERQRKHFEKWQPDAMFGDDYDIITTSEPALEKGDELGWATYEGSTSPIYDL